MRAIRAERLGSYSIVATLPGMPSLSRLKSMLRYFRLCPPPWCRTVIFPWLFRPAFRISGTVRDFSGLSVVISSKVETVFCRTPGEVGLKCLIPMVLPPSLRGSDFEDFDRLAVFRQLHNGLFPVAPPSAVTAEPLHFPADVHRVHLFHFHSEDLFHRLLDLRLVGLGIHFEDVFLLGHQIRRFFGDHRTADDVARVFHRPHTSSTRATASRVRISLS